MVVLRGGPSADVLFEGRSARRNEIFDDERVFAVPREQALLRRGPSRASTKRSEWAMRIERTRYARAASRVVS